jgi:hypothetical protein
MKKLGLVLLFAAALVMGLGGRSSEAFSIDLSPTYLEQRSDVTAVYGSQESYVISKHKPYSYAELKAGEGAGALWAYNGRGIESYEVTSEAVIGFGGRSGYYLPSSGSFLDSISGNSVSRVSYALSLSGGSPEEDVFFSVTSYENTYPATGFDVWHSITLKDMSSNTLLQWTGDLSVRSEPVALKLKSDELYALFIESHGDFSAQVFPGATAGGEYLSLATLRISAQDEVAIPAPASLVLLVSALGGCLALRKKIALWT